MELDYAEIGKRIARRRKELGLKQSDAEERADIGYKYLSNIERGISIPSTEVIMRLAIALDTTPDEFLVGAARQEGEEWKSVAELLRPMDEKKLALARSFLTWLSEQDIQ
ncbi:MAG: helix-turn-helix domain-containing protein [Oscillospiraceae bacterium]